MSINLPQKPRPGFHSISELNRALNGVIDYLASFVFAGDGIINVHRSMFRADFSIDTKKLKTEYDGYFKVTVERNTITISDGIDEDAAYAGYAYFDQDLVPCESGSISAEEGYLLLTIEKTGQDYAVSYEIEDNIPDMPTNAATTQYPLAEIKRNNAGKWEIRQISRYELPELWNDKSYSNDNDYTGMLKLSIEEEENDTYLNISWPESGSNDATLVGMFENTEIHWNQREEMTGAALLICFDPYSKTIFTVKAGNLYVSYWKIIGKYDPVTKTVSQLWRSDRPGDGTLFDGYSGAFAIRYDKNSGTVQISGGNVSVNNTNYTAADFTGSMGESSTMYYYVRHRVAQSASSGDEDPDLTDEQKQALRTTIANCDSAITTANAAISQYNQTISSLVTQRTAAYNAISAAYTAYNNGVTAENSRHDAVLKALDPADPDYNAKVNAENTLHSSNLSSLASTRDSAISAQQTIISGLYTQINTARSGIASQQSTINTQTQTKNTACLQLYGVIPASAGCEIVALPSSQSVAQTDQYLYIYIGQVSRTSTTVSSVSVDRVTINQAYLGSIMAFYRMDSTCGGLL